MEITLEHVDDASIQEGQSQYYKTGNSPRQKSGHLTSSK